ncbi:MAG: molybdenum cofactor biosynthesis protein MoaE [Pseudomonadota bacterium]
MQATVRVQAADFDVAAEYAALCGAGIDTGAVTMFVGRVRSAGDLAAVHGMHLEHYPGMTERELGAIVQEAGRRWPLQAVRIVHRVGELSPGGQIVFVGVAGAHRAAAFAACEFLIDWLKTRAPFWKRETSAGGASRWVEQKASDRDRAARWELPADRKPAREN